ncbi:RHS repeat-associated core domain-containing protein [Pseudomonas sp. HS6-2]|uniref:RHS repeat-associated core domain-containing protein n=1 Tax=Pseudomonas sp. HS6-2 TaxID=3410986 RepID=UPI003BD32DC6
MVVSSLALQHDGTPEVDVNASTGDQARGLRLLRAPDAVLPPRWLATRKLGDRLARTVYQFGARPLRANAEAPLRADATTLHGLGGQLLRLHTVDGDATQTLTDSAGRSLWSCNAQGTAWFHAYETPNEGGRLLAVFEQPAGGRCRQRERLQYSEPVLANRERNLAGGLTTHFDNAGVMHIRSLSLGAQALETQRCLLPPQAQQPDWVVSSEDELEQPLLMTNQYDAGGALLVQVNAVGVTRRTTYDISGAVAQVWMAQGAANILVLSAVRRRADGVLLAQTAGNGVVDTFTYSARSQRLMRHCTARPSDHALGALVISDLHYRYDPVGNILTLDDQGADPAWHRNTRADGLRTYAYDTLYRLVSASGRERTPVAGTWAPAFAGSDRKGGDAWGRYTEHYSYDDGDNLIELSHNGGAGSRSRKLVVSVQSNRALPEGHNLTPETGFLAGGLQRQLADGRPLSWQADNQLRQVSLVTRNDENDDTERYHYADGGTRTRKITTVRLASVLQSTITTYAQGCETRLRQRDDLVQRQVSITDYDGVRWVEDCLSGHVHLRYGFTDHLGSSAGETNALGELVSRDEYAPFGDTTGCDEDALEVGGLLQRTLRYSGKERDATGLYHFGWRFYQPALGRWLSADPAGTVDGVNLFRMCRNNPVRFSDPNGSNPEDDVEMYEHDTEFSMRLAAAVASIPYQARLGNVLYRLDSQGQDASALLSPRTFTITSPPQVDEDRFKASFLALTTAEKSAVRSWTALEAGSSDEYYSDEPGVLEDERESINYDLNSLLYRGQPLPSKYLAAHKDLSSALGKLPSSRGDLLRIDGYTEREQIPWGVEIVPGDIVTNYPAYMSASDETRYASDTLGDGEYDSYAMYSLSETFNAVPLLYGVASLALVESEYLFAPQSFFQVEGITYARPASSEAGYAPERIGVRLRQVAYDTTMRAKNIHTGRPVNL